MRNNNALITEDQRIQQWLEQKPKPDTTFYTQLFGQSDGDIQGRYEATNRPTMLPVAGAPIAFGNPVSGSYRSGMEARRREDLALYVVRSRVNSGVRNSIRLISSNPENSPAMRNLNKAQRTIDTIRNQQVTWGSGPEPLIFKFGYDLVTDVTQVYCQKGSLRAGLVHAGSLAVLSGGSARFSDALVHLSTSFGKTAPRAFVGVPLNGHALDLGLAHTVAPGTEAQLRYGAVPANGDLPDHKLVSATIALPF